MKLITLYLYQNSGGRSLEAEFWRQIMEAEFWGYIDGGEFW
jgi:hypothetical protein